MFAIRPRKDSSASNAFDRDDWLTGNASVLDVQHGEGSMRGDLARSAAYDLVGNAHLTLEAARHHFDPLSRLQSSAIASQQFWRHYPPMLQSASLGLIKLYQRHLSPRKGYVCALRARTGGRSCSRYAACAISRAGVWSGATLLQRRLRACGAAAVAFAQEAASDPQPKPSFEERNCGGCATSVTEGRKLCCGSLSQGLQNMWN